MWPDMNEQIALRKLLTGDKITKLGNLDIATCIANVNGKTAEENRSEDRREQK